MTIEVQKPELEALIRQRMTDASRSVEDVLIEALRSAAVPAADAGGRTGVDLVAAMQASPCKDVDLSTARLPLPVRDVPL
ncbi:MAG TPA: hypothetical protein VMJ34_19290 [Bryobacteraceae bacterium]|nr:hypothetical protein [Bryobacteraceae bacterium]